MFSPLRKRAGRRLREPFGKAGLTVAVLALVFAMIGGAWAAAGLNGKQKKEVKAIAKSFQGTGPAGAAGAPGAKGDTGAPGANGANGTSGTDGASATTASFSGALHGCTEGGVEVKSASAPVYVCNGKNGTNGTTGFTEALPSGKSLYGTWGIGGTSAHGAIGGSISFGIPLASVPAAVFVPFGEDKSAEGCPGTFAAPTAGNGTLCIYGSSEMYGAFSVAEASKAGATFTMSETGPFVFGLGSWAVTAP